MDGLIDRGVELILSVAFLKFVKRSTKCCGQYNELRGLKIILFSFILLLVK